MTTAILASTAVAPEPLRAQSPAVTVGGVIFAHYVYFLSDTANHVNNFDVTRAYVNVVGRFDALGTRVTPDIYRVADGSLAYRLKYAYFTYTPARSPLTFKLGQIQTGWIDWEETLWEYRMQGTIAMDRAGYVSSSDFGLGLDGRWRGERVNAQLAVVNGENYNRAPGDRHKDLMARVSVRLAGTDDSGRVGGVRLSAYGQLGAPTGGGSRQRILGMLSYRSRRLTVAGELAFASDSGPSPAATVNGRVITGFAVVRFPPSKVAAIARVDVVDPNTATANNQQTRVIAGLSYQLAPNLRLLADIDHLVYQGGSPTPAANAVRSQGLLQVQATF